MNRPELDDVSSSRLKMRPDVELEVEKVVTGCGFRRVSLDELGCAKPSSNDEETKQAVTSWNRTLHLYERVADE